MIAFVAVFAGTAVWVALLVWSRAYPSARHWPPRRGNWGTALWSWGLTAAIYWALFDTATTDWNPWDLPRWLRWATGGTMTVLGTVLQTWGTKDLGLAGTSGWDVGVVRRSSYAVLRHPQYWGQAGTVVGFGLLAANPTGLVAALLFAAALWLASDTEERFLTARYPDYRAYADDVGLLHRF